MRVIIYRSGSYSSSTFTNIVQSTNHQFGSTNFNQLHRSGISLRPLNLLENMNDHFLQLFKRSRSTLWPFLQPN